MTINEENKIEAYMAHPRLVGGRYIGFNILDFDRKIENDITFVEWPREPNEQSYFKGPETRASDMLKVKDQWEPTLRIKTGSEGITALPEDIVNNEMDAEISGDDREEIDISSAGHNTLVHFGATKIKDGSVSVVNETTSTTLEEDTDYMIDYYRGMIEIYESAGSVDDTYSIGYIFKNTARNIAYTLTKIPRLGGASSFVYGNDSDYTGSTRGFQYSTFIESMDLNLNPEMPDEAEASLNIRHAFLIDY